MNTIKNCIFAVFTLLALATSCHKTNNNDASENKRKTKDTIIIGTSGSLDSPDLLFTFTTWTVGITYNLSAWLYRVPPGSARIEPELADGWPAIKNDTEYTIKIKRGFTFADGTPVDAHAVVESIERVRSNADSDLSLYTSDIQTISAIDDYTVLIVIKSKNGRFSSILSSPAYAITNSGSFPRNKLLCTPFEDANACADKSKMIDISAANYDVTKLLGSGPYRIDSWVVNQDQTRELHLSANPNFPGLTSKNKKVILRSYYERPDPQAAAAEALRNKEIDLIMSGYLKPEETNLFISDPDRIVTKANSLLINYLAFRNNAPPFDNVNCRLGIAAAIDRPRIASQAYPNQAKEATSLIPEGMWGRKEMFGPRDLALAKQYLEQCRAESSAPEHWTAEGHLKMEINVSKAISKYLKESIEETGIVDVTIMPASGTDWYTNVYMPCDQSPPMMAFVWGWTPDYFDPDNCLSNYITGDLAVCFRDTEIDNLISRAQSESDVATRTALYEQIQDLWSKKAPVIPLISRFDLGVAQKGCTLSFSASGDPDYKSIECEQ